MRVAQHRALVVEDDRSWQQILTEILTDADLAVDVVDTPDEAVACLRETPHRVAVVDLALGDGDYDNQDGLLVLDAIRRQDPGCVTIMLTGFATVELAVSALSTYGAFTCLRKETFDRAEFGALVAQALASVPPGEAGEPSVGDSVGRPSAAERPGLDACAASRPLALVVEDDASWRGILSELLADAGHQVRVCGSYGEAVGCLRRERYSLAVIDLSLTGLPTAGAQVVSGDELQGYRLLSSTRQMGVPTIVVSGVVSPEEIERAYSEQSIFACLGKQSFDRRTFLDTVAEARAASALEKELECLTRREREVLDLLARGLTNREIADRLVITTNTVKRHLKAIFAKLDVHTRSAAAAKAINAGLSAGTS